MATVSFAVGSVCVAIVWGTFFYPPPPKSVNEVSAVSVADAPAAAPLPLRLSHPEAAKHPVSVVSQLSVPPSLHMTARGAK
jgi:hypothetical protein